MPRAASNICSLFIRECIYVAIIGVELPVPMTVVEFNPRGKCCGGEGTSYKKWDVGSVVLERGPLTRNGT